MLANVPENSLDLPGVWGSAGHCILGRIPDIVLGEEAFLGKARRQKALHFLTRSALGNAHGDNIQWLVTSRGVARSYPANAGVGIVKVQPGTGSWRQTRRADVQDTSIAADAKPCVYPGSRVGDFPVADMEDGQVVLVPSPRHTRIMTCRGSSGDTPPVWASVRE